MKRQVRFACTLCEWVIVTDIYAESEEELDKLPKQETEGWDKNLLQHYRETHSEEMTTMQLKRLLKAKL